MAVERQVFCTNPSLDCLNPNKAGDSPSSIYNWHCVLELDRGLSNLTLKDLSTMQWKQNDWRKYLVYSIDYFLKDGSWQYIGHIWRFHWQQRDDKKRRTKSELRCFQIDFEGKNHEKLLLCKRWKVTAFQILIKQWIIGCFLNGKYWSLMMMLDEVHLHTCDLFYGCTNLS